MKIGTRRLLTVLALLITSQSYCLGAEVVLENRSNDPIFVAVAYAKWKGDVATEGWVRVDSNGSHTIRVDDSVHLHIRIEMKGSEVTFKNHQSFLYFPTNPSRYVVSKPSDDPSVRIMKWGTNLENSHNIRATGAIPQGWEQKRFFHVGKGNLHLHVNP